MSNINLLDYSTIFIMKKLKAHLRKEARYDDLYAVCTNLDDDVENLIKLSYKRCKIEGTDS